MTFNLLDVIKSHLTPEIVAKLSQLSGESDHAISKAISAILPLILGGLSAKAKTDNQSAEEVFNLAREAGRGGALTGLSEMAGNIAPDLLTQAGSWMQSILGDNAGAVIESIAAYAGIKTSSVSSVLGVAAPATLGALGNHIQTNGLTVNEFTHLLQSQNNNIAAALPEHLAALAGVGTTTVQGTAKVNTVIPDAPETQSAHASHHPHHENETGGLKWLLPLLMLIGLGLLAWYFAGSGCGKTTVTNHSDTLRHVGTTEDNEGNISVIKGHLDTLGNYIYEVGADRAITLSDSTVLHVGENSTEAKLFEFLNSNNKVVDTVDKTKEWYTLDRVYFESGKSVLTPASQQQLKNIAAILKMFPDATVKFGGYTDNTGPADVNTKISGERAKVALQQTVREGIVADRLTSEGYGPLHPVCEANDTPECKAQNRRVDIRVTKK